jgi:hypothetical protein
MYHGWNDPGYPRAPTLSIIYQSVEKAVWAKTADRGVFFLRLVSWRPGMAPLWRRSRPQMPLAQAAQKPEPERNMYRALELWVEQGTAPARIIATKYKNDRNPAEGTMNDSEPFVVPFRTSQNTKGLVKRNDAVNFVCTAPGK